MFRFVLAVPSDQQGNEWASHVVPVDTDQADVGPKSVQAKKAKDTFKDLEIV